MSSRTGVRLESCNAVAMTTMPGAAPSPRRPHAPPGPRETPARAKCPCRRARARSGVGNQMASSEEAAKNRLNLAVPCHYKLTNEDRGSRLFQVARIPKPLTGQSRSRPTRAHQAFWHSGARA
jgi:hypothetical protein